MPIDPKQLKRLIALRRFEDFGRRLAAASAGEVAAIPTLDLLVYLVSLSDHGRRTAPGSLIDALRRRRPTDLGLAVPLAGSLMQAGLREDAGQVVEVALENASDKESLASTWIHHLIAMGLPGEARAQLALAPGRQLGPVAREQAAARLDVAERLYESAVARLEAIARRHPEAASLWHHIDRVRIYAEMAARFAATRRAPRGPPDYAVFAINLDEHAERFAILQRQIPAEPPALIRIPGVKGRYLPDVAAARLAGESAAQLKGSLGCFLAHVVAWERFRASVFDHALFVEDDAVLAIDLPPSVAVLDLPPGYELCFAGDGMEPPAPLEPVGSALAVPVAAVVPTKSRGWRAPGGYGYFLSRRGVGELLDRVARDGFAGDVDWRLVAYSLSRADGEALPPDGFAIDAVRRQHALIQADQPLAAYCLYPALLQPGRVGSIRKADNIVE